MTTKKFPDQIFVVELDDGGGGESKFLQVFYTAEEAIDEAGDGGKVAAYFRDKVVTASIVRGFKGR